MATADAKVVRNPFDATPSDDWKLQSARGGMFAVATQLIRVATTLGSTIILARLLSPEVYGLVAIAASISGLIGLVVDGGLSTAAIQMPNLDHRQASNLFWINSLLGLLASVLLFFAAPAISKFFDQPELKYVLYFAAMSPVLSGLANQHRSLLYRQMNFLAIAQIQIASIVAGVAIAIVWAYYSQSWVPLMVSGLISTIVGLVGSWISAGWFPGLPNRSSMGSLLNFGANMTATTFLAYLMRNADNLLIGWWWGPASLGLYSKAYGILMLPLNQIRAPIGSAMRPTLSRLRSEPANYNAALRRALITLAVVGMPPAGLNFVITPEIISVMLGSDWLAAVPIYRWLIPPALLGVVAVIPSWVSETLGQPGRRLQFELFNTPIMLVAMALALPYSVTTMAMFLSIAYCMTWPLGIIYCCRGTIVNVWTLVVPIVRHLVWVAIAIIGAVGIRYGSELAFSVPVAIVVWSSVYIGFLLLGILVSSSVRIDVVETITWLRKTIGKK